MSRLKFLPGTGMNVIGSSLELKELRPVNPKKFLFGAHEVPGLPNAILEVEKYLKKRGIVIGESKIAVECDSPEM